MLLFSEGKVDPQKEPKSRLLWFCLVLGRLLSFRLLKEPFIGAVCKCANWERLTSGQHENHSLLQSFLTNSSPTVFGCRISTPRQRNCLQCLFSVREPLGHLRSHSQCIKHLPSPWSPKPASSSASWRSFLLRCLPLPRRIFLCPS